MNLIGFPFTPIWVNIMVTDSKAFQQLFICRFARNLYYWYLYLGYGWPEGEGRKPLGGCREVRFDGIEADVWGKPLCQHELEKCSWHDDGQINASKLLDLSPVLGNVKWRSYLLATWTWAPRTPRVCWPSWSRGLKWSCMAVWPWTWGLSTSTMARGSARAWFCLTTLAHLASRYPAQEESPATRSEDLHSAQEQSPADPLLSTAFQLRCCKKSSPSLTNDLVSVCGTRFTGAPSTRVMPFSEVSPPGWGRHG